MIHFIFLGGQLDLSKSVRCLKLVELSDIVTSNQAEGNLKYNKEDSMLLLIISHAHY